MKTKFQRRIKRKGGGLLNSLINKLPLELHLPGYSYCGPGTRLQQRLARGDKGINKLDEACKQHDIAYSTSSDLPARHKEDSILENKAWNIVKSKETPFGQKAAAWFVTTAMKGKRKLGMGLKRKKGGSLRKRINKKKRIIKTPKKGGFLPLLLPLLSALGAVGGMGASIYKAVGDAKANRNSLEEQKRHNLAMEQKGKGLYLRPYKGYGLYLKPYSKN
uniref:Uncharacterized protein LOC114344440 n=1 Tax=Diabrotica virgifera virgifera TaxID=50390 RepID=A0A6P7H023_DIAVI